MGKISYPAGTQRLNHISFCSRSSSCRRVDYERAGERGLHLVLWHGDSCTFFILVLTTNSIMKPASTSSIEQATKLLLESIVKENQELEADEQMSYVYCGAGLERQT